MKLVRYDKNGALRVGALDGGYIVDLLDACPVGTPPALLAALSDTVLLVGAGDAGLDVVRTALNNARRNGVGRSAADKAKLAAPIMPTLLLCSGENYWDHRDEKPEVIRRDPEFFTKTALGVIGPGDDIVRDERVTKKLDYETELAIVIGKPGRHIAVERALEHVYGYTIVNDVTARDRQVTLRADGTSIYNLGPGKNFDTCAPMGPVIVSADEIPDPQSLQLKTWVNDELRQNNSTAMMIWTCAQLIAFFSTFVTLKPGVVIATGTPGGTAWGTDPELGGKKPMRRDTVAPRGYMQPGDVVSCEIQGIGRLTNRIAAA